MVVGWRRHLEAIHSLGWVAGRWVLRHGRPIPQRRDLRQRKVSGYGNRTDSFSCPEKASGGYRQEGGGGLIAPARGSTSSPLGKSARRGKGASLAGLHQAEASAGRLHTCCNRHSPHSPRSSSLHSLAAAEGVAAHSYTLCSCRWEIEMRAPAQKGQIPDTTCLRHNDLKGPDAFAGGCGLVLLHPPRQAWGDASGQGVDDCPRATDGVKPLHLAGMFLLRSLALESGTDGTACDLTQAEGRKGTVPTPWPSSADPHLVLSINMDSLCLTSSRVQRPVRSLQRR